MYGTKSIRVAALLVGVTAFTLPATMASAQYYRPGTGGGGAAAPSAPAAAAPSRGSVPAARSGGFYRPGAGGGGGIVNRGASAAPGAYYRPGVGASGGSQRYAGSGYRDGWRYHHRRYGRGGFWPGFAVGAGLGYGYGAYGGYGYGAYDDYAYDDESDAPYSAGVDDSDAASCAQRFRSYDPASGTYLGYDGLRHPCP